MYPRSGGEKVYLEAVYREALAMEFVHREIPFTLEQSWPITYRGTTLGLRYRVDFFCFGSVVVEVKALAEIVVEEAINLREVGHLRHLHRQFVV